MSNPLPKPLAMIAKDVMATILKDRLSIDMILDEVESVCIGLALNQFGNCKAKAAKQMGINRTTLIERMRRYGYELNPPSCKKSKKKKALNK